MIDDPKEIKQIDEDIKNKKKTCPHCGKLVIDWFFIALSDPKIGVIRFTRCNHEIPVSTDAYNQWKLERNYPQQKSSSDL